MAGHTVRWNGPETHERTLGVVSYPHVRSLLYRSSAFCAGDKAPFLSAAPLWYHWGWGWGFLAQVLTHVSGRCSTLPVLAEDQSILMAFQLGFMLAEHSLSIIRWPQDRYANLQLMRSRYSSSVRVRNIEGPMRTFSPLCMSSTPEKEHLPGV